MHYMIEVVADERGEIASLLREAATKIKRGREELGVEVNHCIGDYRITECVGPDPETKGAGQ